MSQQTQDLIHVLASLAGSVLLGLVFVGLVALCVLLWLGGRALKMARGHVPAIAAQILDRTALVEARTKVEAQSIIQPQIEAVSALAGVQAGARALLRGPSSGSRPSGAKTRSVSESDRAAGDGSTAEGLASARGM